MVQPAKKVVNRSHTTQIFPKLTYFIFMRHGERADCLFDDEEESNLPTYDNMIEHDPPLTKTGQQQAFHAGKYVKERLRVIEKEYETKFSEIRIESSPFLRCLQTGAKVAQALDKGLINVNYHLSESKNSVDSDAPGNPIKNLDIRLSKKENFQRAALDGIEVRDTDLNFESMC